MPLWITESGSAFGGGTRGLSRSFISALGYADKLGLAASFGVEHVMRQSLFGGRYKLFDIKNDYEPSPEYWIAYLFGSLNGIAFVQNLNERFTFTDADWTQDYH